jgi:hypothetical protein
MVIDTLIEFVGILVALSAASERLVDIAKGFIKSLQKPAADGTVSPAEEARRKAIIQAMAVAAGLLTTWLAWPIIGSMFPGTLGNNALVIIGLGFLVSGGSGLWNSILSYLLAIKDLKRKQAAKA